MSRRLLQTVNAIVGLLTIALASMQFVLGPRAPIYAALDLPAAPVLDSNLRFFAGMGLGLGLILLWITPSIERRTHLFRAVWFCAFLGGIGRLVSMFTIGMPPKPIVIFTIIEIPVVPILIIWQSRVAKQSVSSPRT